ncbi:hypothetical protein PFDG_03461 [Plasmodium falciparum Dd2]|uniref:Uncharacterized protein n=1 Tax=Plasmodium falciparum (isolate Dd2) TaxID=57267 RepID=A0A0L7M3K3_PLAF4|nr:hypothetical protein PFDG_03461 [Plasmodium falciparum Dd2]
MKSLRLFNRRFRYFSTLSTNKRKWQDLSFFLTNDIDTSHWREMTSKINEAENLIKMEEGKASKSIDWVDWNEKISNKELLSCMKNFYDNQMKMLQELGGEKEGNLKEGEEEKIFEDALKNCKESEEISKKLLVDGAKTLWINFHNPNVSNVDNNEWIDSDLYWQSFIEKHSIYNLNNKNLHPEDDENCTFEKNEWHRKTNKFNERSDTPILYDYMINLPSWEYYDINRRLFLENMLYFLLRTGLNFRFFPEIYNWKWIAHIEDLRYQYLNTSHIRRKQNQLKTVKREVPLELQPLDYEHKGEEFHLKLLQHFKEYQNLVIARLMSNYIFLCDPYIPVQTRESLQGVLNRFKRGKLYKLVSHSCVNTNDGKNQTNGLVNAHINNNNSLVNAHINNNNSLVKCLFFLPDEEYIDTEKKESQDDNLICSNMYKPLDALQNFYSYLKKQNIELNDSYIEMLNIFTQIIQERGQYWLHIPNEKITDTFLRRYNKDDSLYPVFVQYCDELNEAFLNKVEILPENYHKEITYIEKIYQEENRFFHTFVNSFLTNDDDLNLSFQQINSFNLLKMNEKQIDHLIKSGKLVLMDEDTHQKITDPKKALDHLKNKEMQKQEIREFVKSLPL